MGIWVCLNKIRSILGYESEFLGPLAPGIVAGQLRVTIPRSVRGLHVRAFAPNMWHKSARPWSHGVATLNPSPSDKHPKRHGRIGWIGAATSQYSSSWRKPSEAQNVQKIPKPPNQYPNWGPYLLSDDDYPNVSKPNYKIMIQTTPWLSKPNAYPGPCEFMVTHANSPVPISSVLKSLCPYWPHAGWIVGTWAASSHGTWWHLQAKHRSKSCTSLHGHMKGSHESHCYFHFKIGSSLGR